MDICPGFITIIFQKKDIIKSASIIFPWAIDLLDTFQFIEVDASFKPMRPYTFGVAQGVIHNESLPFAISIAPTESFELYSNIFEHHNSLFPQKLNLRGKALLSDIHLSIKSLSDHYGLIQFFCHRHIIEHFEVIVMTKILRVIIFS